MMPTCSVRICSSSSLVLGTFLGRGSLSSIGGGGTEMGRALGNMEGGPRGRRGAFGAGPRMPAPGTFIGEGRRGMSWEVLAPLVVAGVDEFKFAAIWISSR